LAVLEQQAHTFSLLVEPGKVGNTSLSTEVLVGVYLNHVQALKVPVENMWMALLGLQGLVQATYVAN